MGGQIEDCGSPDFKSVIQPHELPAQSELDQLAKSYDVRAGQVVGTLPSSRSPLLFPCRL